MSTRYYTKLLNIKFGDKDLVFEEEILRNRNSVKHWLRYIQQKKKSSKDELNVIYERALKQLPGSYELWYNYLRTQRIQVKKRCEITRTRKIFDGALRALPINQQKRIWPLYLNFVKKYEIPETAVRVFRRYLKLFPENAEEYITYLKNISRLDECATLLAKLVNDENFISREGKSKHQLWIELCELISKNPKEVVSLNVDAIIREGLRRFTENVGQLWNLLADYYIRIGLFERARDIHEEAIQTVTTERDFNQTFNAYVQFVEPSFSKRMEEFTNMPKPTDDGYVGLWSARIERLRGRRLLLLNSVFLRQNPHNVRRWHEKVELYEGKPHEIINIYKEALQTVDPKLAIGTFHTLWIAFAKFYEKNGQIDDARLVFEQGTQVPFTKVDDLAEVWWEWSEMEIRNDNFEEAFRVIKKATTIPSVSYHDDTETAQNRVHKSLILWYRHVELEEHLGSFESCKAAYNRMFDFKIATPIMIVSYSLYLEELHYFEEAFKIYEKGISLFKWPNVFFIWNKYLIKFVKWCSSDKLERARGLFEQCLEECPPDLAKNIYLLYAKLEEEHGMAEHAMNVYERATSAVPPSAVFEVFNIYIKKAAQIYDISKIRQIYEKAINVLPKPKMIEMCTRFAEMETKLGEIDRARAIYTHCSQICQPRVTTEFWQIWSAFEIKHGCRRTIMEMSRIKRSVQTMYITQLNKMRLLEAEKIREMIKARSQS